MADMLTDLYRTYLEETGDDFDTPGTHAYEWENYIKPNSPSTDMYHQMAMYNQLENEAPKNKWLRKAFGLASFPGIAIGSPLLDISQSFLDYGIDQGKGKLKGPMTSYIGGQNPFPQAWNRMKGATQFVADQFNLPMGKSDSGRNEFRETYNRVVNTPRNIERTASRVDPSGRVKAYGLNKGGLMSLV